MSYWIFQVNFKTGKSYTRQLNGEEVWTGSTEDKASAQNFSVGDDLFVYESGNGIYFKGKVLNILDNSNWNKVQVNILYTAELTDHIDKPTLFSITGHKVFSPKGFQKTFFEVDKTTFNRIELQWSSTANNYLSIGNIDDEKDLKAIQDRYKDSTPTVKEIISKQIERGVLSNKIKKSRNFECQICKAVGSNPHPFIKKDGTPYVETHHIEFVSKLSKGANGILNLITVCPNHHRQIHFGNVILVSNDDHKVEYNIDNTLITILK